MTDPETADATYVTPMTPELVEAILAKEKPDAILPTMGGQTALNLAKALAEVRTAVSSHRVSALLRPCSQECISLDARHVNLDMQQGGRQQPCVSSGSRAIRNEDCLALGSKAEGSGSCDLGEVRDALK
jgi:hypothetical protein